MRPGARLAGDEMLTMTIGLLPDACRTHWIRASTAYR
jgi:hypothetical protein